MKQRISTILNSTNINFVPGGVQRGTQKENPETDVDLYVGIRYILEQARELSVSVPLQNVRRYIILEEGGNTCLIQFQEHAPRRPVQFFFRQRNFPPLASITFVHVRRL